VFSHVPSFLVRFPRIMPAPWTDIDLLAEITLWSRFAIGCRFGLLLFIIASFRPMPACMSHTLLFGPARLATISFHCDSFSMRSRKCGMLQRFGSPSLYRLSSSLSSPGPLCPRYAPLARFPQSQKWPLHFNPNRNSLKGLNPVLPNLRTPRPDPSFSLRKPMIPSNLLLRVWSRRPPEMLKTLQGSSWVSKPFRPYHNRSNFPANSSANPSSPFLCYSWFPSPSSLSVFFNRLGSVFVCGFFNPVTGYFY